MPPGVSTLKPASLLTLGGGLSTLNGPRHSFSISASTTRGRSPAPSASRRGSEHQVRSRQPSNASAGRKQAEESKEAAAIMEVFKQWDTNGSGSISRRELKQVMAVLMGHMSEGDIDVLMDEADTNNNGKIEVEEFVRWLTKPPKTSVGKAIFDYHEALRPIWHCYDRDKMGSIDKQEFEEVHCILQACLRMFSGREDGCENDPLHLADDSKDAFRHINQNGDDTINYLEFVQWMKDHIPANMPPDDLKHFCHKLATTLEQTFYIVKQAEEGNIHEDDAHILENALKKLAKTTRQFQDALDSGAKKDEERNKKAQPPLGLNIERLKGTHMKCFPVNMSKVTSVEYEAYCFPLLEMSDDAAKRDWIAQVTRTIKSWWDEKEEPLVFYRFEAASYSWVILEDQATGKEIWEKATQALEADVGLMCLMSAAANFGKTASWDAVQKAFAYATELGFIGVGKGKKYVNHIKKHFLDEALAGAHADDVHADDVLAHLQLKAVVVMGLVSEVGVM
mmetsp:Transcript_518/g.1398  ORF Transcript_518/g.1398 Transcript_518/m.1398 type:complete len:508 (-) Transcript_518:89-1612(-)